MKKVLLGVALAVFLVGGVDARTFVGQYKEQLAGKNAVAAGGLYQPASAGGDSTTSEVSVPLGPTVVGGYPWYWTCSMKYDDCNKAERHFCGGDGCDFAACDRRYKQCQAGIDDNSPEICNPRCLKFSKDCTGAYCVEGCKRACAAIAECSWYEFASTCRQRCLDQVDDFMDLRQSGTYWCNAIYQ